MKRSRRIHLVLIGGMTAGITGCGDGPSSSQSRSEAVSANAYYTNNHYLPGAGYYHAPFRGWYAHPYNHFDAGMNQYYYGGRWALEPHESITNISAPTPEAASRAQAVRSDVTRRGFGSTSRSYSTYS